MKILVLLLVKFLGLAFAHNEETSLKNSLLASYDRTTKPEGQTKVSITLAPLAIHLCPHKQMLKLQSWNSYSWIDERLAWNPAHYGNITETRFNYNQIWVPDITVYNIVGRTEYLIDTQGIVYSNGKVLMVPNEINKINCEVNYDNLPFGKQKCSFKIGSWHNGKNFIDLEGKTRDKNDSDDVGKFLNGQIEITNLTVSYHEKFYDCCPDTAYPHLLVDLEFNQKMKYDHGELKKAE